MRHGLIQIGHIAESPQSAPDTQLPNRRRFRFRQVTMPEEASDAAFGAAAHFNLFYA
jgi:hypothetical protein